nr:putative leader peptide [Streptomyces sp. WMMB 714]
MGRTSGPATGNRYDEPMVVHDVSASSKTPGTLLVGRLHVDLCRLASALGASPCGTYARA